VNQNQNQNKTSNRSKRYDAEFKRAAVEMLIHGGKALKQVARELGVSEYSLHLWRREHLNQMAPAEVDGQTMSPLEMAREIRRQQREIEWLRQQREILKKAMSILGETPNPGMR
jgi:transposase